MLRHRPRERLARRRSRCHGLAVAHEREELIVAHQRKDLGGRMDQQDVAPGWSTLAHATLPRLRRTGGEKPLTLGGKIVVIRCGEVSNHAARNAHFIGTSGNRDTNHRTAGFAGRTRRRGGSMAARGGSAAASRADAAGYRREQQRTHTPPHAEEFPGRKAHRVRSAKNHDPGCVS
jgi:hypothetical protein